MSFGKLWVVFPLLTFRFSMLGRTPLECSRINIISSTAWIWQEARTKLDVVEAVLKALIDFRYGRRWILTDQSLGQWKPVRVARHVIRQNHAINGSNRAILSLILSSSELQLEVGEGRWVSIWLARLCFEIYSNFRLKTFSTLSTCCLVPLSKVTSIGCQDLASTLLGII